MKKVFAYHRHLMLMEARKDIILENDFINRKTKSKNESLFSRYSQKIKENKMRLYYLAGFCLFFSLGPVYDFICDSKAYDRVSTKLSALLDESTVLDSALLKNRTEGERKSFGEYFLELQRKNPCIEITSQLLSFRLPIFKEYSSEALTLNQFVDFCHSKGISVSELPTPTLL